MKIYTPQAPYTLRDFSRGRYAKTAVSPDLVPKNSVSDSVNVNFDEIIGSAKVRKGTTVLGSPVVGTYSVKDGFYTGDNDFNKLYLLHYSAQVFQATSSYTLKAIKLKMYKALAPTDSFQIYLCAVDGSGVPITATVLSKSGGALASGISTTSGTGALSYFFPMSDYDIVSGTKYAIVFIAPPSGDASNYLAWRKNTTGAGGSFKSFTSTDEGATWSAPSNATLLFDTYSVAAAVTQLPLGFGTFTASPSTNDLIAIFDTTNIMSGILPTTENGVMFYYDTKWNPAYNNGFATTVKTRMATMNGQLFLTNTVDGMRATNAPINPLNSTNCIDSGFTIKPGLIFVAKNRMLASGYVTYPSRVYFSSIVAPASSPFITWSTNATTGDFIDFNPDDGGNVTGFSDVPSTTLVFKSNGFYRLDVINKAASQDPISDIGAVSQEGITVCQNITYYFSGSGIWRTSGDLPELISRLGVQDFIDAIPQANWTSVVLGADDFNVYVSIGDVTLNANQNNEKTYNNVVLKFSVRDQNWSVHSYADEFKFFTEYTTTNGQMLFELDSSGNAQSLNTGTSDNGVPIFYELITQDQEFGSRAHLKNISDKFVVFMQDGQDGQIQCSTDGKEYVKINLDLDGRVNIGKDVDVKGHFFNFRWFGQSSTTSSIFEGLYIDNVIDQGAIDEQSA